MNHKLVKNILAASVATLLIGTASQAVAQEPPAANVTDRSGNVVMDRSGECVRTRSWAPENVRHSECAGYIQETAEAPEPDPAPEPEPEPEPEFETTTLSAQALFDFDSAELRSEGRDALRELARSLTADDAEYSSVLVEGHTCTIGPADYNQGLSERRAQSVADFLASEGVREDDIRTVGYGEDRPTADNSTREGREANRRVEVTSDVRQRAD
ncbi:MULTISPECIES: OmpA family protein [unclassified Thioalkalivibrio]|uniref:OmpA family protein n=1 Tax=unclassified Thioalkalivibrio TaxID=2621013 RepID=UPI00037F9B7D|nr:MULTISPECIES: OmpA family protein [unclassified Thioalkalivibrio]